MWIISNTTEAHIKSLQSQFEFINSFNGLITSERAGTHKPHPNIYKFALDHNLNDLNYNEVSTELNFGKVQFNLDYLEQRNHIGDEHYASSGITLNFNDYNKLSFSTKKNFKTESTELYDISYQYAIDCLKAGVVYRREFYRDADDLEPKNSLMFTITFVPFGSVNTPVTSQ